MTVKKTVKVENGRLSTTDQAIDADILEVSQEAGNALQVKEDGLFVPADGGGGITINDVKAEIAGFVKLNPNNAGTPVAPVVSGNQSTALGYAAEAKGDGSTSFGYVARARSVNTTAIGFGATTGANSTGSTALGNNARTSGLYEVAIGYNTTTSLGYGIAIGISASAREKSIAIGGFAAVAYTNSVSLGYSAKVTGTDQIQLGDSTTTTYTFGAVQDRSDQRDKTDVQDCDLGLEFINALTPRKYKWDYREDYAKELFPLLGRDSFNTDEEYQSAIDQQSQERETFFANPTKDGSKTRIRYHYGLIAQELKQVMDSQNTDFGGYQDHSENGGMDVRSIGYVELIPVLIKAVQELSAEVERLKK